MESLYFEARTKAPPSTEVVRGTAWLLWPDVVATALHVAGTPLGTGFWAHEKWFRGRPEGAGEAYSLRLPGGAVVHPTPLVYDPMADVALLRLPEGTAIDEEAFAVLAEDRAKAGDPWHAVGYPAFEANPRAIAIGGAVTFVGEGIANNTMQLLVDQGTSVAWGGMSGSAAESAWGEVIGVVLQTVSGTATSNAAPAEAVKRLLRLRGHQTALAEALAERLRSLGNDATESIANGLWGSLSAMEGFEADPPGALARRIAESGEGGLRLALSAIRSAATATGKSAPAEHDDPIVAAFEMSVRERPSDEDLDDVLRALVDAGGQASRAGDLAAKLPEMPAPVFSAAIDALLDRRLRAGSRGLAGNMMLTWDGARRVVKMGYLRAVLRALAPGNLSTADLGARTAIGPEALRRALVCAERLSAVAKKPGGSWGITSVGQVWLALRPLDAEPRPDGNTR